MLRQQILTCKIPETHHKLVGPAIEAHLCTQSERFQGYAPKKYFRSLPHPAEQAAVAAVLLVGLLHKLCSTLPQTAQRLDGRHPLHRTHNNPPGGLDGQSASEMSVSRSKSSTRFSHTPTSHFKLAYENAAHVLDTQARATSTGTYAQTAAG